MKDVSLLFCLPMLVGAIIVTMLNALADWKKRRRVRRLVAEMEAACAILREEDQEDKP